MDCKYPKLMMFDLDDTLINFDGDTAACWRSACAAFLSELNGITLDDLQREIKSYAEWFWSDPERHRWGRMQLEKTRGLIVNEALKRLGVENTELGCRIGDTYTKEWQKVIRLFPETIQVLSELRQKKQMALVTNGQAYMQREKIERFGLARFFDYIVIEGEFGIGKPDQRVFEHVLNEFGTSSECACMVGDNLMWDILGPQKIGIQGIWCDRNNKGLPTDSAVRPDKIIQNLSELI